MEIKVKNSIKDAHTSQPGENISETMEHRRSETQKDQEIFRAKSIFVIRERFSNMADDHTMAETRLKVIP